MNRTDAFVRNGWRHFRHETGSAYLLDAAAGYLGHTPGNGPLTTVARQSGGRTILAQANMANVAVTSWASGEAADHELQLTILGARVLVRFGLPPL